MDNCSSCGIHPIRFRRFKSESQSEGTKLDVVHIRPAGGVCVLGETGLTKPVERASHLTRGPIGRQFEVYYAFEIASL